MIRLAYENLRRHRLVIIPARYNCNSDVMSQAAVLSLASLGPRARDYRSSIVPAIARYRAGSAGRVLLSRVALKAREQLEEVSHAATKCW